MKSILELEEQRSALLTELEALEARLADLTDEEVSRIDAISDELRNANDQIEKLAKLEKEKMRTLAIRTNGMGDKPKDAQERFSWTRAVEAIAEGKPLTGLEAEMHAEGTRERNYFGRGDVSARGIVVPSIITQKRAVVTENGTAGVQVLGFSEALRQESVLTQLGVDFVSLVSDGRYAVQSATTSTWENETANASDGGQALAAVTITPKRLTTYVDISLQTIKQHSVSVENAFIADIAAEVAEQVDAKVLTDNATFTGWVGTGLTAKRHDDAGELAMSLIEQLYVNKGVRRNTGFAVTAALYAEVYQALQVDGVTPLIRDARINGFPAVFTPQVGAIKSSKAMIFGNWNDYVLGNWGGVEILVDPYTQAIGGKVRLVLNTFWDGAKKQTNSFVTGRFKGTETS